ncbi:MAG: hypothetical protein IJI14_20835 [Anaerolineaceae bacterium]|nr:hypothetical protein [Anaerolineaceae bacterium]
MQIDSYSAYVSMTRARKYLHIFFSNAEYNQNTQSMWNLTPSRFIADFPEVEEAMDRME